MEDGGTTLGDEKYKRPDRIYIDFSAHLDI